jgi:hypothetical protein
LVFLLKGGENAHFGCRGPAKLMNLLIFSKQCDDVTEKMSEIRVYLVILFMSCVTLKKLLPFSGLQFPHLKNKEIKLVFVKRPTSSNYDLKAKYHHGSLSISTSEVSAGWPVAIGLFCYA